MTENELGVATGKVLVYLKGYNYKLCRKGLLERGIGVGKSFGEFKNIENEFMKRAAMPNEKIDNLLTELKERKSEFVEKELRQLKNAMEALKKTIENAKKEVQSKISVYSYGKWLEQINGSSMRLKKLFSDEFNSLYNHLYKKDKKFEETLMNIVSDIARGNIEICDPFVKKRTMSMVSEANETRIKKTKLIDESIDLEGINFEDEVFNSTANFEVVSDDSSSLSKISSLSNVSRPSNVSSLPSPSNASTSNVSASSKNDHEMKRRELDSKFNFVTIDEIGDVDMSDFDALIENL